MHIIARIVLIAIVVCYVSAIHGNSEIRHEKEANLRNVKTDMKFDTHGEDDESIVATDASQTVDEYNTQKTFEAFRHDDSLNDETDFRTAKENTVETADILREKASKAAKVGAEYAQFLGERAAVAAEIGNKYLAEGAKFIHDYTHEYVEQALKYGQVFKGIAAKKLQIVASETFQSAKEFTAEAMKISGEYGIKANQMLQDKAPEIYEVGRDFLGKAIQIGQEYGKETFEKTGQLYETGKGKAEQLLKDAKKKFDF